MDSNKWKILNSDSNRSIIDVILENRDLPAEHMNPFRLSDRMHSPHLLTDMKKGVERILSAMEHQEKIIIFGDYDVDGVTSSALMINFFRRIDYPVDFILPHREKDGYGLRNSGIDRAMKVGAKLIITVDNGISSAEAVDYAAQNGIDVVITDHHLQEGDLPAAAAVINPNRNDSEYPFKTICGVSVAFKVVQALCERLVPIKFSSDADYKQFLLDQLDLVAIGTIADVMPLVDENYALVKFGLKVLASTKKPGLIALKKISRVDNRNISPISVGFFLGPRLNASGRIGQADLSLKLLISETREMAENYAKQLNQINNQRQTMQAQYLEFAMDNIAGRKKLGKVIIIENEKWQSGLIGLVSGHLKEQFSRPVIAFTTNGDGDYVGSGRSIGEFHITDALSKFSKYFVNFGGHQKAAGVTVFADKYQQFKKEFLEYAENNINENSSTSNLVIDSKVDIDQLNVQTAKMIQEIGPFGEANPEPILVLSNALIKDKKLLGQDKHLKLSVQKGRNIYECVWWRNAKYFNDLNQGESIDVAFHMNINNWQNIDRLQLTVTDIHKRDE
jgi:single-stranded-DNA-specific exonuclease